MTMPSRSVPVRRSVALALLLCAPFAQGGGAAASDALRLALRAELTLPARTVTLDDVAELSGVDAARWRALALGQAPAAGSSVRLGRQDIEHWLRARAGLLPSQIHWSGADGVTIHGARSDPAAAAAALADIVAGAQTVLRGWLERRADRVELAALPLAPAPVLPPGPLELRFPPPAAPLPLARHMQVRVELWQAGHFLRALPLSFAVAAYAPAWVARSALQPGSRPGPDAFERREIDLAGAGALLALPDPDVAPAAVRLRQHVAPGGALTAANSELAPPVCHGDTVLLLASSGGVALERKAEALQDGGLGQLVSVRLSATSHSIQARVTGAGTVEVQ